MKAISPRVTAQLVAATVRGVGAALLLGALIAACSSDPDTAPIATEAVSHHEVDSALATGDIERAAIDYAQSAAIGLPLSAGDDFEAVSVTIAPDTLRHVRLQQVHRGVPVRGSQLLVHADDSTFLGLNGTITKNLDGFDVEPAIASDAATTTAKADHADGTSVSADAIDYSREAATLVILPGEQGGADLVWHIEFFTEAQPGVEIGRWQYFVDARSGVVLSSYNGLHTLEQASGPGGNGRVARTWSGQLDVEEGGDGFIMETERMVTFDLENTTTLPDEAVSAASLTEFDDPAVNDAQGFVEITLDMLLDWLALDSLDGNGFVVQSRVHYDVDFDVAFWDGTYVTFGDSAPGIRYPRSGALDIVAHEMGHGITEFHSGLIYSGMPGGLNESFSDILGTMAEFYDEGDGADWDIGEDIYVDEAGRHRSMCNPAEEGSLDDLDQFDPSIGVHTSSGIANRAFCLSVARISGASGQGSSVGAAVRRVGSAWYTANVGYWPSAATFKQGCQGVVDAARALGFSKEEVAHISQSWEDVGVLCGGNALVCDDDDSCDVEDGETCASCSSDCGSCSEDCGFFKRAKCRIGLDDCSRCDLPEGCGDGFCTADEDDTSCAQDCGCAAEGGLCGTVAPFGCWCDIDCESRGDCCQDVEDACF